jgi:hypothetical protein
MKIKVYVHTSPEAMFARGKAAGLTDEAADYFRYYGEVPLTLEVDETSGEVLSATTEEAAERIAALETALRTLLALPVAVEELSYLHKGIGTNSPSVAYLIAENLVND